MKKTTMKSQLVVTTIIGAAANVFVFAASYRMTPLLQVLFLLGCALLLTFIIVNTFTFLLRWKLYRWKGAIPLLANILGIGLLLLSRLLGQKIADRQFQNELQQYNEIVVRAQKSNLNTFDTYWEVPFNHNQKPKLYLVRAIRRRDGNMLVEFISGVGFPNKHHGYVYSTKTTNVLLRDEILLQSWTHVKEIESNWYRVSD